MYSTFCADCYADLKHFDAHGWPEDAGELEAYADAEVVTTREFYPADGGYWRCDACGDDQLDTGVTITFNLRD